MVTEHVNTKVILCVSDSACCDIWYEQTLVCLYACLHIFQWAYEYEEQQRGGGGQMERERYCRSVWDSGRMAVGDRPL